MSAGFSSAAFAPVTGGAAAGAGCLPDPVCKGLAAADLGGALGCGVSEDGKVALGVDELVDPDPAGGTPGFSGAAFVTGGGEFSAEA